MVAYALHAMLKGMSVPNPLEDLLRFQKPVSPCSMVIFGANGDLTKRKLLPALYRLAYERRLPTGFSVVGVSRTEMTDEAFREKMRESVQEFLEDSPFDNDLWTDFERGLFYMAGDVNDAGMYRHLGEVLDGVDKQRQTNGSVLFYLSTQPSQYARIAAGLGEAALNRPPEGRNAWRRLIVEKPFGHDLASARELSDDLRKHFDESQIYRIDHYLGKETVQNILAFRFGNGIFEPLWNRRYINHVQITAAESIGVEGRGAYYQEAGALRDMIQNHLLQVMATMAMEPPAAYESDAVRDERAKLLRALKVMKPDEVLANTVSGQYGPAQVGGKDLPGFRAGERRQTGHSNRYVRRRDGLCRKLALGGSAVLYPDGQTPAQAGDGHRHPIQFSAPGLVPGRRRRGRQSGQLAEFACPAHSARGGHFATLLLETAGCGDEAAPGDDGLQLRHEFRRAFAGGVRDTAARRAGGRRHVVHAPGHGGRQLDRRAADPRCVGVEEVRVSQLRRGNLGAAGRRRHAGEARAYVEGSVNGCRRCGKAAQ